MNISYEEKVLCVICCTCNSMSIHVLPHTWF